MRIFQARPFFRIYAKQLISNCYFYDVRIMKRYFNKKPACIYYFLDAAISSISLTVETQRTVLHNSERKYFYPDNIAVKCSLLVDRM